MPCDPRRWVPQAAAAASMGAAGIDGWSGGWKVGDGGGDGEAFWMGFGLEGNV